MTSPLFLAGEKLPASKIQLLGIDDETFIPALQAVTTNPTLGVGAIQTSHVWLNGQLVNIWFRITFGTASSPGSGIYQIPLPGGYPLIASAFDSTFGTARLLDDSTTGRQNCICGIDATSQYIYMRRADDDTLVTHSNPWTFADLDTVTGHVTYLTDFGL